MTDLPDNHESDDELKERILSEYIRLSQQMYELATQRNASDLENIPVNKDSELYQLARAQYNIRPTDELAELQYRCFMLYKRLDPDGHADPDNMKLNNTRTAMLRWLMRVVLLTHDVNPDDKG